MLYGTVVEVQERKKEKKHLHKQRFRQLMRREGLTGD